MKLSDRMRHALTMLRLEGTVSPWTIGWGTYNALLRRDLVDKATKDARGWDQTKLSAAGKALLDRVGAAPTEVRCPCCKGSGRVPEGFRRT